MMRLIKIVTGCVFFTLIFTSRIAFSQTKSSTTREECLNTVNVRRFEGRVDGPSVTEVGYSRKLKSCIVVAVQSFGGSTSVFKHTDIIDVSKNETVWTGMRTIPISQLKDPYLEVLKKLKELDAETLPRKKP